MFYMIIRFSLLSLITLCMFTGCSKPPVINEFSAESTNIIQGNSTSLVWKVDGASEIFINNNHLPPEGSQVVSPTSSTKYTLTASNSAGFMSKSVVITVTTPTPTTTTSAPTPTIALPFINSFAANPTTITNGQSSTLQWNITGASSVSINQNIGTVASSGTKVVSPTSTTTYTITATNSAGIDTTSATITVTPSVPHVPSPVTPTVNPTPMPPVITNVTCTTDAYTTTLKLQNPETSVTASFEWRTENQQSSSQVEWGTTISYGNKTGEKDSTTTGPRRGVVQHRMTISGLLLNTTYHYRVLSKNSSGLLLTSDDYVFTTPATARQVDSNSGGCAGCD